eukprot:1139991-Pelagomonas_calceolata.AAC.5
MDGLPQSAHNCSCCPRACTHRVPEHAHSPRARTQSLSTHTQSPIARAQSLSMHTQSPKARAQHTAAEHTELQSMRIP